MAPIEVMSWGQNLGNLWAPDGFPVYADNDSVSFADTLTKVTNTHTIKLGG